MLKGHKLFFGVEKTIQKPKSSSLSESKCWGLLSSLPHLKHLIWAAAKLQNLTIIQVHAPTTVYGDKEVELFYKQLQKAI